MIILRNLKLNGLKVIQWQQSAQPLNQLTKFSFQQLQFVQVLWGLTKSLLAKLIFGREFTIHQKHDLSNDYFTKNMSAMVTFFLPKIWFIKWFSFMPIQGLQDCRNRPRRQKGLVWLNQQHHHFDLVYIWNRPFIRLRVKRMVETNHPKWMLPTPR